jgi:hypothetical protein
VETGSCPAKAAALDGKIPYLEEELIMIRSALLFVVFMMLLTGSAGAASFDHSRWDELLVAHVVVLDEGRATMVDYPGMVDQRSVLTAYLAELAEVPQSRFDSWAKDDQLAFLINAYNAWTVELILTGYPDIQSIKELGSLFRSPWKKPFIPLFGETLSLDEIEHGLIRGSGRYAEPRIHFAVNCASIGCPALSNRAYRGDILEEQLDQATVLFLSDSQRNRYRDGKLQISSIFKWYREDFEQGWRGAENLPQFLALYAESLGVAERAIDQLVQGTVTIEFLDYDWKLNGVK